jgi:hypothetical protein
VRTSHRLIAYIFTDHQRQQKGSHKFRAQTWTTDFLHAGARYRLRKRKKSQYNKTNGQNQELQKTQRVE